MHQKKNKKSFKKDKKKKKIIKPKIKKINTYKKKD